MEGTSRQSWIKKHPIFTGVIAFFILMFFIGLISDGSTTQTETSKVGDSLTGNVVARKPESSQEEVEEEEGCDWGYVNDYKCDGGKILKKWIKSDCSFEWFYYLTCSYDCQDGECVDEPIQEEETNTLPPQTTSTIKVTRVIDGDTIEISTGERVRLICIDTPETYEDYYQEAKDYLTDLILNKEIELIKDKSETDRYDRLLRYIYLDGDFVNEMIVEDGWAVAYPYSPDTTLCPQIQDAEAEARSKNLGIWIEQEETNGDSSGYICSYNAYNCADFSTHAEAQAVYETCGSGDIHRLDRDSDGLACETLP